MDKIKNKDLFTCEESYIKPLFEGVEYPWEILPKIKGYIAELVEKGIEGFTEIEKGVLVGEGVKIAKTATIEPPCIIGAHTEIRPGAYLRGNVITGPDCVLGNSSEMKNCVLLSAVHIPHYNYVGDSVLGVHAHMGAGSVLSNLKSDGRAVVIHGEEDHPTGLRKVGSFLADGADIGCGCVLNPGTVIGRETSVYPLTALRGVYPEGCIVKAQDRVTVRRKDNP